MTTKNDQKLGFATRVIHAGQSPDPSTGAIMPPIYATSTYVQQSPGVHKGLDYGRSHNPTRWAFERCVADLEGGAQAFAFASGLAAISTVLELIDAGSHVVASDDLYGGSFRLFDKVRQRSAGLRFSYANLTDPQGLEKALQSDTKLVWVETPTNPLLRLADLRAIAETCRARGIITVADNTFASPYVQRPLELGFDVVVHSVTKYLNGHSDVIGGIAIVGKESRLDALRERLGFLQNSVGAIASPFDSFLALRGVKTLALRMQRHCESALELARWLEKQPAIERVYYPGLPSHPQHELAMRQQKSGGGIVSFDVKGGKEAAWRIIDNTRLLSITANLGDTKTTITHPASTTHGRISAEARAAAGIGEGLLRVAVGLEALEDIRADLARGLR